MQKSLALVLSAGLLATGCDGPLLAFKDEIRRSGHIPFENPLAFASTGTLVGGTPDRLQLIAPPETCFPSEVAGQPTRLRFVDNTALPRRSTMTTVGFSANVEVLGMLSTGNGGIGAGVDFQHVDRMELAFDGVHIEYMDSIRLTQFYRESLGDLCKDYLDRVAFVVQAIQAEKTSFKFYSKDGGGIRLSMENLKQFVDVSLDLRFEIINQLELVITTPKYLGYQLGKLQRSDQGLAFQRASRVRDGRFLFESIDVFGGAARSLGLGRYDASPGDFAQ
jgi:hypothetical protein